MVDRCVCCGKIIPEGVQVCITCRNKYGLPKIKKSIYVKKPKNQTTI